MNNRELTHHGILGMKWGVQNGPPYPLAPGDHSASERRAGWRKSLKKDSKNTYKSLKRTLKDSYSMTAQERKDAIATEILNGLPIYGKDAEMIAKAYRAFVDAGDLYNDALASAKAEAREGAKEYLKQLEKQGTVRAESGEERKKMLEYLENSIISSNAEESLKKYKDLFDEITDASDTLLEKVVDSYTTKLGNKVVDEYLGETYYDVVSDFFINLSGLDYKNNKQPKMSESDIADVLAEVRQWR